MRSTLYLWAVILAMIITIIVLHDKAKKATTMAESAKAEATYWRDEAGRSNAEIQSMRVENFKLTKLADSLKEVKIKPKTVEKVVTVTKHTTDTVTIVKGRTFGDRWASFDIDGDLLKYRFTDSLALITYRKRVGFMKTAYVTRVISFNPYTTITGMTSTEIIPRTRRLSLGLHGGYGIQFQSGGEVTHGWNFGVGINYRIF